MRMHAVGIVALLATGAAAQRYCCQAVMPQCEACKKGMTVEAYCQSNPNALGCDKHVNIVVQPPAAAAGRPIVELTLPKATKPTATFDTSLGTFVAELYLDRVPRTVSNFIDLASSGFYDGLHFHRVIPAFMAQFGCPYSIDPFDRRAGTGGPPDGKFTNLLNGKTEKRFNGGMILDEHTSRDSNSYGTLSMANTGQPNTGGSQFFVNVADNSFLDWFTPGSSHPVFGKVTRGMDVVVAITLVHTRSDNPETPIKVNKVTITGAPTAPLHHPSAEIVGQPAPAVPGWRWGPTGGTKQPPPKPTG